MKRTLYFVLDYYDRHVIQLIIDKYDLDPLEATRRFLTSQTHALLEDPACCLMSMPDRAIFDMWEAEQIVGDPRASIAVRGE